MSSGDPTAKTVAVKDCTPGAVHRHLGSNAFLHTSHRHDDFENRSGSELRLNGFVQQRFGWISDELTPFLAGDSHGEGVGIKGGAAHHGEHFAIVGIHRDHGAIMAVDGLLGRHLHIQINREFERFTRCGGVSAQLSYLFPVAID